jgi:hypothetical protein
MCAVAAIVSRHGLAFSGAAAARVVGDVGRRTCVRLPRPFGYRAVMIARVQACGRLGRGGPHPSATEFFTDS